MKHSAIRANELHAAKRLILTHVEVVVDFLMHNSGLTPFFLSQTRWKNEPISHMKIKV